MWRALFAASIALALAGCAGAPKTTPPVKVATPKMRAIVPPVSAPEARPTTFKQRWMPKFKIKWLTPK
jgi:hypothetical protein